MSHICTDCSLRRRRKELAKGKTSKVALDDCNFRSPSSRGELRVCRRQASWLPAGDGAFKATINSFVVAGLDSGTGRGGKLLCEGSTTAQAMRDQRIHSRLNPQRQKLFLAWAITNYKISSVTLIFIFTAKGYTDAVVLTSVSVFHNNCLFKRFEFRKKSLSIRIYWPTHMQYVNLNSNKKGA